jgi:hypothetical protein
MMNRFEDEVVVTGAGTDAERQLLGPACSRADQLLSADSGQCDGAMAPVELERQSKVFWTFFDLIR